MNLQAFSTVVTITLKFFWGVSHIMKSIHTVCYWLNVFEHAKIVY